MLDMLLLPLLAASALAAPQQTTPTGVRPQFKSAKYVGNVTDPSLDRDSCGSTRIGSRAFWTCRDTMAFINGESKFPIYMNTAAWSPLGAGVVSSGPVGAGSTGKNAILQMYGEHIEYFPAQADNCPVGHGQCSDDSGRWVYWPNSQPIVTQVSSTRFTAYQFIAKSKIKGFMPVGGPPAYMLWKQVYTGTSDKNKVPAATVVAQAFWKAGEIGYGDYGNVIRNGYAYLYGKVNDPDPPALARVKLGYMENKSAYEYYVSGKWVKTMPKITDSGIIIPNCGAGWQGTYYYSAFYKSFIWIGQKYGQPVAWFYISTAPAPEGPWVEPYILWKGQDGTGFVGAYTLQANPALLPSSDASENAIYLTWTQPYNSGPYITPLAYIEFQ
ncbi:hypothetical protein CB0940_01353 [Cercospora beticola]|uniref:DUF4185 domain-containing protein n=1 Tax=Cercospora beticola TaxID=122368 RepID=A0A2G5I6Q4_CERBT|nr:hypothetical protein CB0940_01353 [Cercospora beticola]PIB00487.1 hypothetical protein CB0940_01353 [Cercospora beticola]WPA96789.1 hypothetical protein RHO25_001397 [Cercospora beticola]CAK1354844.1 unnamed protein product [Cercospora beticola]